MPGPGGTAHLSAAHLQAIAGVKMVYVPYKGLGTAMNDIVAGHVDMMFDTLTTSLPLHQQGRVRIIAVASPKRVRRCFPIFRPSRSSGYPDLSLDHLVRTGGAAGHAAARSPTGSARTSARSIKSPQVIERLNTMQMEPVGSTREEAAAFFADEARYWGQIIKDANIALQ